MRAWTIMIFLILFSLSLNVVGALEIYDAPEGEGTFIGEGAATEDQITIINGIKNFNWLSLITTLSSIGTILAVRFLNLTMGAAIYSIAYGVVGVSLGGFINQVESMSSTSFAVSDPMLSLLGIMITFVFLWGFIKLAS